MTLQEFEKLLKEDPQLQKQLKEKKAECKFSDNNEENASLRSKIIAALGFDVPASEFLLEVIEKKELNDDELMAVAGGCKWDPPEEGCGDTSKVYNETGQCYYDYVDTDCWILDYCDWLIKEYD